MRGVISCCYSLHDLLLITVQGPEHPFTNHLLKEWRHFWRPSGPVGKEPDLAIKTGYDFAMPDCSHIESIGGGAFYDPERDCLLIARSEEAGFFNPRDIYLTITNYLARLKASLFVDLGKLEDPSFIERWAKRMYNRYLRLHLVDPLAYHAERALYRFIEPMLFRMFLDRDILMAHAAAVEFAGEATVLLGFRNVGKTSVALRLASHGGSLLSDDLCLLGTDGTVLAYPKLVKIEGKHHLETLETFPLGTTLDRILLRVAKSFRGGEVSAKVPPCHLVNVGHRGRLSRLVLLSRRYDAQMTVRALTEHEAARLLAMHTLAEFWGAPRDQEIQYALSIHRGRGVPSSEAIEQALRLSTGAVSACRAYIIVFGSESAGDLAKTIAAL